jgi:rare lipoprotein A
MIGGSLRVWLALASLSVYLSACAESQLLIHAAKQAPPGEVTDQGGTGGRYKVGDPYQIGGVWYYPAEDYGYNETGIASWYGKDFHAKATANGEVFDMNKVSAAHRTLAMPSLVRVTNLDNGRSIVVRVNDRGPFAHGRIIDMSRRSAQLLGFEMQGTAKVRVEALAEESRQLALQMRAQNQVATDNRSSGGGRGPVPEAAPRGGVVAQALPPPGGGSGSGVTQQTSPPAGAPGANGAVVARGPAIVISTAVREAQKEAPADTPVTVVRNTGSNQIYVQAGAFANANNALRLQTQMQPLGQATVNAAIVQGQNFYRVRIGPLASVEEADQVLERVIGAGQGQARVVVD